MTQDRVLLSINEVCKRTSLSRSQIYNLLSKEGSEFPKSFRLAKTSRVAWDSVALQSWIDRQCEQADGGDPAPKEPEK
jgi:predicted DNA-binding transcriptional regulator AlpA